MKRMLSFVLSIAMLLSLAACGSGQSSAGSSAAPSGSSSAQPEVQPRTLRFAHRNSDTHMFTPLIDEFAQKVKEQTNGEIIIEVFGNNILGDVDDILEQVSGGSVDINLGGVGNLGKFSPKYNSIVMPFLFEGYDHANKTVINDFLPWVRDDMEAKGFHILDSVWAAGFRQLTSNKAVNTAADVSGIKVRTPPTQANREFVTALGGVAETVAFSELYNALKQGLVDAQENPLATIYANQYYECQSYLAVTNHLYDFDVMVFNTDTWNSLTAKQQEVIGTLATEYGEKASDMMAASDDKLLTSLQEKGMTITHPDVSEFRNKMDGAFSNLSTVYGADNVKTMLEMADKNK